MKKILFFVTIILLFTTKVYAKSDVYSINMDIYLNQNGDIDITERWDVKAEDGSEWFKQIKNLNDINITNYKVLMDNVLLTEKTWNVNEGLEAKKGYFGINKIDDGIELCFGKYNYNRHTFTIKYTMTNVIFNTEDAQVMIGRLINPMPSHNFEKAKVVISSFYYFPDNLDVWGTGYKGLAYVNNGKIYLSNEENLDMGEESYINVLIKFPNNTFTTTKKDDAYKTFDDVKNAFDEGTFDNRKTDPWKIVIPVAIFASSIIGIAYLAHKNGYGYKGNKKITEKTTPAFRDIPCKKDLFYANTLMKLNNFGYSATSILGALILKWVKENKITFVKKTEQKTFKEKEDYYIDMTKKVSFDNSEEEKIFNIMLEASGDGMLEANEFKKWARINATRFQKLFKEIEDEEEQKLRNQNHIYKRTNKEECSCVNVLDDMIYEDSKQLLGLKIFLKEFSEIDKKETIEVHLWDEYLMFAYLFGIADKVFAQLKKLYPELIEQAAMSTYRTPLSRQCGLNMSDTSTVRKAQASSEAPRKRRKRQAGRCRQKRGPPPLRECRGSPSPEQDYSQPCAPWFG